MLQIGSVIDGKYKILSEVGRGGMSVVYLALNERANKTWAIKEVRKDGSTDFETTRQGLIAETDILKKLKHPHIVSIVDVLESEDCFLIVMDYIEGRSLQKLLNKHGAQPVEKVVRWGMQLCDVLGYLHSRTPPIIYRDMKPANVMLQPDGNVVLTDFGTAREYKLHNLEDTACLGTRGYAAPEQFGGRGQTDARTDIYCLGVTMYHLITGHSPLETNSVIPPVSRWLPGLAQSGIEKIIQKCCQPEPQNRYQNCAELMYALEHVHDLDNAAIRSRRLKWGAFVASCAVTVLSLAGMAGFSFAERSETARSYEAFLAQARSANTFEEAAGCYRSAMDLSPGRPEAYELLLETIDNDVVFTSEENTALRGCILNTDGGTRTNLDRLAAADRESWTQFIYRMATDYYFFYEGTDRRARAANWFEQILDSSYLSEQERTLAAGLTTIGKYDESSGSDKSIYLNGAYDYRALWDELVAMTDGDVVAKTGGTRYAAALYGELVYQLRKNAVSFKSCGVTRAEMTAQLDKVSDALGSLAPENEYVAQQIEDIRLQIDSPGNSLDARTIIDAAFQTGGTGSAGNQNTD